MLLHRVAQVTAVTVHTVITVALITLIRFCFDYEIDVDSRQRHIACFTLFVTQNTCFSLGLPALTRVQGS